MNQLIELNNQGSYDDLVKELCTNMYYEAEQIARNNYPLNQLDIFMEIGNDRWEILIIC